MFCSGLSNPSNGQVDQRGNGLGSVATYSCHSGYNVQGGSQVYCTSDGKWSGEPPSCKGLINTGYLMAEAAQEGRLGGYMLILLLSKDIMLCCLS